MSLNGPNAHHPSITTNALLSHLHIEIFFVCAINGNIYFSHPTYTLTFFSYLHVEILFVCAINGKIYFFHPTHTLTFTRFDKKFYDL